MRNEQSADDKYDLEFLIAKQDLAANGVLSHIPNTEWEEGVGDNGFIVGETFFRDLGKASQRIKPKSSSKPSKI